MTEWLKEFLGDGKKVTGLGLVLIGLSFLAFVPSLSPEAVKIATQTHELGVNLVMLGFGVAMGKKEGK